MKQKEENKTTVLSRKELHELLDKALDEKVLISFSHEPINIEKEIDKSLTEDYARVGVTIKGNKSIMAFDNTCKLILNLIKFAIREL